MLHDIVTKGSTDRSVTVKILDATTGAPKTDVVYNSAGIALWYRREGAAVVDITEATLAALTTAHADGGFLHERDGVYRLDLPDAAFATGANHVDFGGTVTGGVIIGGRVRLVDINIEVANIPANVTQFGGTNATTSGGRPEVNTSHLAGSAVSATAGLINANITQVSGDATAADNLEAYCDGTTPQPVNVTQFGGTNATTSGGRPEVNTTHAAGTAWGSGAITAASIATDAIGAAELAADAVSEIAAGVWAATTRRLSDGTNIVLTKGTGVTGFNDLDAAGVRGAVGISSANLDTQLSTIDGVVDAILVDTAEIGAAGAGLTALASSSALAVVDGIVDSILVDTAEIGVAGAGLTALASASALATVDTVVDAIKVTTDKLDDTLEDSGGGAWIFTVAALANAPAGGGGGTTDWTANERTAIRSILGIPASGTTPEAPSVGILATIESQTDDIGAAGAGLTALASAADLATVDTVVDAIKARTDNLPTDPADASDIATATSAILSAVGDVPTNAELATALAGADDAVLAAVAGVQADTNDIQTRLPAALVGGRIDASVGAMAANVLTAAATATDFGAEIADAVHDEVVDGTLTARQSLRLQNAAQFGKASGAETVEITYRDAADTRDRITATVDEFGNRTAVTLDAG